MSRQFSEILLGQIPKDLAEKIEDKTIREYLGNILKYLPPEAAELLEQCLQRGYLSPEQRLYLAEQIEAGSQRVRDKINALEETSQSFMDIRYSLVPYIPIKESEKDASCLHQEIDQFLSGETPFSIETAVALITSAGEFPWDGNLQEKKEDLMNKVSAHRRNGRKE